ncbi:thioredoxin-domain-containing protein [Eremomyces bilateralis CBS 781.70]|uniref:Thioredoxin-domain-containing protein n=1 Tax=Eremomyces bilateralis CBS 781.70 TaxID=1392243 RepID=A0A6G1G0R4_9PEZI|nr:thioredoxin-domain-containing protein [Eremomyces bilateralis CBS 781.70]KAF1811572.1 thioredoxin-domain-containing protein [Eremomyces bilateralis CBS 781.70]
MPSPSITAVTSLSQFQTILSGSTYVVADFFATWCGPCKVIAPVFEQLATQEGKKGNLAFVKVDVDQCQEIAQKYGVSAMPTFLVFRNSTVTQTIRGADAAALRAAVRAAAQSAGKASGAAFTSKGHVLGSGSTTRPATRSSIGGSLTGLLPGGGLIDTVVRFVALYVTSLFSFDSYRAAELSPFALRSEGGRSVNTLYGRR